MSRAYKNKKYNKQNYIRYSVSPKYFGVQATRFPGSIKEVYCDTDRDELADVTFTKRRSPAVRKNYTCLTIGNFAPKFGPSGLASIIIKPASGPLALTSEELTPPTDGPSSISSEELIPPTDGPSNISSETQEE